MPIIKAPKVPGLSKARQSSLNRDQRSLTSWQKKIGRQAQAKNRPFTGTQQRMLSNAQRRITSLP